MVCELWDLTRPALPPRSRLYPLEPVGLGTPAVESLTGYVARLAEAHGVRTSKLVVAELLPRLGRPHLLGPVNRGVSAFWQRETRAVNGTRTLAHDLVQALEALTLRHDLRFLTLLTWAEVVPPRGLVRPTRAWCPACYDEWQRAGQVVYEPLLWALTAVTACPRHRRRLRLACPHADCGRPAPPLGQQSRPGHCAWCERWLGTPPEPAPAGDEALAPDELRWQAWVGQALGELLAAAPGLAAPPGRERVPLALRRAARQVTGGNVSALADRLGLRMVTLASWAGGRTTPCLGLLLQACDRLGTLPRRFLLEDGAPVAPRARGPTVLPAVPPRPRAEPFDAAAMRRTLEAVLASDERPPPSMREIARRVGVAHSWLHRQLPELCRAISRRYLAYHQAKGAAKRRQLCAEVRQAALEIHAQGLYPSAHRIAPLISQPGFIRDHEARAAWQDALHELGWRT